MEGPEEREGDSLVVQHGSVRTARFLDVCRLRRPMYVRTYVRTYVRARARERSVRAWHACVRGWRRLQGQSRLWPRRRALLCATGAPWTRRTRRFGRSDSTLKHGIYCGNSFCSTLPFEDRVSAEPPLALPLSLSGWHIRMTLLNEST